MTVDHIAFFHPDVEGLVAFYAALFESEPAERADGYARFRLEPVDLVVHTTGDAEEGRPPMETHVGFAVDDVDESFETLAGHTVDVVREPAEYEWGRSAYLRTPDGTLVEIGEYEN